MTKAESFYYREMNNGGHFQFETDVYNRAKSTPAINSKFKAELEAFGKAIDAENAALKLSTKSLITDQIEEADALRDRLYPALVKRVETFLLEPDKAGLAKQLEQAFKDYRIRVKGQRDKESGMMGNLILDMRTKYAAAVKTLGLTSLVDQFAAANQQVIDLMQQRTEEQKNHVNGTLKAARAEAEKAYHTFIEKLNAYLIVEGDAKYADFVSYLNAQILHYRREVLGQKAKGPSADTGDEGAASGGNSGGDEEEPPQG
ncbi:MAG: DUF6261 family protein [Prevotellaceae bacterium]|jgi:hypothetical protein|nr:DUF6261 family protein [Prevotellaceae bacterium]